MPRVRKISTSELNPKQKLILNSLVLNNSEFDDGFLAENDDSKAIIIRTYLNHRDDLYISENIEKFEKLANQIADADLKESINEEIKTLYDSIKSQHTPKAVYDGICVSLARFQTGNEKFDQTDFVSAQIFQNYFNQKRPSVTKGRGNIDFTGTIIASEKKQQALSNFFKKFLQQEKATTTELMVFFLQILERRNAQELLFDPVNMTKLENIFYENADKICAILARPYGIRDFNNNLSALLYSEIDVNDKVLTAIKSSLFDEIHDQILARFYYAKVYFPLQDETEDKFKEPETKISQSFISCENFINEITKNFTTSKNDKTGFHFGQIDFREWTKTEIGDELFGKMSEYQKARSATYLLLKRTIMQSQGKEILGRNESFRELETSFLSTQTGIAITNFSKLSQNSLCQIL